MSYEFKILRPDAINNTRSYHIYFSLKMHYHLGYGKFSLKLQPGQNTCDTSNYLTNFRTIIAIQERSKLLRSNSKKGHRGIF
jgi:hypothetical protein